MSISRRGLLGGAVAAGAVLGWSGPGGATASASAALPAAAVPGAAPGLELDERAGPRREPRRSGYALERRDRTRLGSGRARFRDTIGELAASRAADGLTIAAVEANRQGGAIGLADARTVAPRAQFAFHWNARDDDWLSPAWMPQGITGSYDDSGTGGGKLLVSWYDNDGRGRGLRLSLVDWPPVRSRVGYRHLLLAEPYRAADGRPSFAPVRIHGGGLAAYGGLLYVADTSHGLRVFDLAAVLRVSGTDDRAGTTAGARGASAFGYRYVVPQIAALDNAGRALRYSCLSVDRTGAVPALVTGEFDRDGRVEYGSLFRGRPNPEHRPKAVSWPVPDHRGGADASGRLEASAAVPVGQRQVQGVVRIGGAYYLSRSRGQRHGGQLRRFVPDRDTRSTPVGALAPGPQDLTWDGTEKVVWTLGEYRAQRFVYAVDASP